MDTVKEKKIHQGGNVRRRRNDKGYTQEYMSEMTGIPLRKFTEIESSEEIDDKTLDKIAKVLDTDINWFKSFDPINDVAVYNNHAASTNTSTETSTQNNNQGDVTIYYPIDEVIKVTDKALALQKDRYESETVLLKQLHEKELRITLLEKELAAKKRN